ncbi:hypothetical protein B0H19DRAFT_1180982 [Mycena capillaripes]|nr:hypothetical protein B0H19DRAFT_1180982 [Mycena capillaripes]
MRTNTLKTPHTGILKAANFLGLLLTPLTYSIEASGEHQLYALLKVEPGAAPPKTEGRALNSRWDTTDHWMRWRERLWKRNMHEATAV